MINAKELAKMATIAQYENRMKCEAEAKKFFEGWESFMIDYAKRGEKGCRLPLPQIYSDELLSAIHKVFYDLGYITKLNSPRNATQLEVFWGNNWLTNS